MSEVITMPKPLHEVTVTSEQRELIKRTICAGATDQEMQVFFYDCERRGVHPLDKLIHFTKRSGKYTPITSIDFMRQRAHQSGSYAGEDEPIWTLNNAGAPESCQYAVYRMVQGQRCKWTATARWDEYFPGESVGFMWKKMPFLMLCKCAEALALRKAFPAELQGLYANEEMDQAGPEDRPSRNLKVVESGNTKTSVYDPTQSLNHPAQPTETPDAPYKKKLLNAASEQEVQAIYNETPDELKQEIWSTYSDMLKAFGKKKKP